MNKLIIYLSIALSLAFMLSFETPPQRMLFIGDSLTCYNLGWQHQVATQTGHAYTNLAVGGYIMGQMKYKMDDHLKKDALYSKAFIYGGCNDGFCLIDLKKSLNTTQAMVDTLNKRGIKPIVVIGFDAATVIKKSVYDDATTVKCRNRYAQLQQMMVDSLKNCKIIPFDPNFKYEDTADGIHFRASGHKKLADWVLKHL